MDDIKSLFQIRDNAVAKNNTELFISTQIDEIANASVNGYMSSGKLKTEVINIADDTSLKKVVFVKKSYGTHSTFLLYYLVNTVEGWKIYKVVSN